MVAFLVLLMKAIIPLAGVGTRLRPHTHTKPKPLIKVAGKAVLGHILDRLKAIEGSIEEVIFVTGEMGEQIEAYVSKNYNFKARYIEQDRLLGDGYAVNLAKEFIEEDVLIVFVDTIFETDLNVIKGNKADGIVWVKETDTPERFGIVQLENGFIKKIVEKPSEFISNLAVIGLYYFRDGKRMMAYLDKAIKNGVTSKGEYRMADAISLMIQDGIKLESAEVKVWADCGKPETLLETNRYLLSNGRHKEIKGKNSVIIPPVYIEEDARIENSIIGPYVSVAAGCNINGSIIRDSIIDQGSVIENAVIEGSLVGNYAVVKGRFKKLNVGDSSQVDFE